MKNYLECMILGSLTIVLFYNVKLSDNSNIGIQNTLNTTNTTSSQNDEEKLGSKIDSASLLFQRLFKLRRTEQLEAVKGLLKLDSLEKQYKMVTTISEKIFGVIQSSRATLESSGYVPGSQFPQDISVRDALSSILENTALFAELILRLPEVVQPLLSAHHDWEILLHWSLSFCSETGLLDTASVKLLNLVTQELRLVEPDQDYVNPYRKKAPSQQQIYSKLPALQNKPKRRKQMKKGPQLSRHAEL